MKKIIYIIAVAFGLAVTSQAQIVQNVLLSGTQTVPAALSNNTSTGTITASEKVEFQWSFKLTGAGTSGVLFRVDTSADNNQWETGVHTFWRAGNGTTAVTGRTNFSILAPFYRVQIHNTNSAVMTNWTFNGISKRGF